MSLKENILRKVNLIYDYIEEMFSPHQISNLVERKYDSYYTKLHQ